MAGIKPQKLTGFLAEKLLEVKACEWVVVTRLHRRYYTIAYTPILTLLSGCVVEAVQIIPVRVTLALK